MMNSESTITHEAILSVNGLCTHFKTADGIVKAVEDVSFTLHAGETLGIVGESGCGKSTLNLSIMRLISPPGKIVRGEVLFKGKNLLQYSNRLMRRIRGKDIAMIFQDPMMTLNPLLRISTQMTETIVHHMKMTKPQALRYAIDLLKMVGIPSPHERIHNYPHQCSVGMCQRVVITLALSCNPQILIADEPSTALDVTIQAQILELIRTLTKKRAMSVIIITHDLGVAAKLCDTIGVMYAGKIVEFAPTDQIFYHPRHPYTQGLLASVLHLDQDHTKTLYSIPGTPPTLHNPPNNCPFHPRCPHAMPICRTASPPSLKFSHNEWVDCWRFHTSTPPHTTEHIHPSSKSTSPSDRHEHHGGEPTP